MAFAWRWYVLPKHGCQLMGGEILTNVHIAQNVFDCVISDRSEKAPNYLYELSFSSSL